MFDIDFTFLWVAVNLLILYLFLKKFLFGRLGGFMEQRSAGIAAEIEKGHALLAQGEALRQKHQDLLDASAEESKKIMQEARERASKEYDALMVEAKKQAAWIITNAQEEAARQQRDAYQEVKERTASLAIMAASKVIQANMDTEKNRQLVESFLEQEGVA